MFPFVSRTQFIFPLLNSLSLLNSGWISTISLINFEIDLNLSLAMRWTQWLLNLLRNVWNYTKVSLMIEINVNGMTSVPFIVLFFNNSFNRLEAVSLWFAFLQFGTQYDSLVSVSERWRIHVFFTEIATKLENHLHLLPEIIKKFTCIQWSQTHSSNTQWTQNCKIQ